MSVKAIAALVIGLGVGLAAGYFVPMILPKPKVTISPNPVTPGQNVTFTFTGFPPNVSLLSMGGGTNGIGSAPINIGAVDKNGNLTITGPAPTNVIAGTVVLYIAFVATNPTINASTAYYVTT